ncbi:glycosyltransferase [Halanaeroarchaeum sulfurireducens]|uniref:Glycosyl transferase group 1 n=1 Tax=Halanaeroarchaeum sulfurireducens TaxID=1604004 RepID=A0A0F7PDL6_9EURY|nr:glycosyltransferase [Halanaeroarchaeum sulfurireducens]AKH97734.1 glycosyl transferase group 1 [Halanaeroarchaeum sulfurireducens]ALG82129.1 glycosyl transferase group 1 [Halanaeroarchaeum sulfurireducens]
MSGRNSASTPPAVAAFTDTYLPTVNGVTYTISAWRDRWNTRGSRMDVVYPRSSYEPDDGEHPVTSVPFPFYDGYRLGLPQLPDAVRDVDVVHAHTPFLLGLSADRLARRESVPLVVSYHTPTAEYAEYLVPSWASSAVASLSRQYESWFLDRADLVLTPSAATASDVRRLTDAPVETHSNGVDVEFFRPTDSASFIRRHSIPDDRPIVGYTGRHGYEKNLDAIFEATADLDVTVVLAGDGPARESLEETAAALDVDAIFLGFLERENLPAFYSTLDVFAFPSPVETQGLVALEANACGTPVVAVDSGALSATVEDGITGYHFGPGDVAGFRNQIERALKNGDSLSQSCLDRRSEISLEMSMDRLEDTYERLLSSTDES